MNREDIIRMANEAGLSHVWNSEEWIVQQEELTRFAALVAAVEREECARACDGIDRRYINQADKCAVAIRARGDE